MQLQKFLFNIIGSSNYNKLRHSYLSFVENRLIGNREVFYSQMGEDMILRNLFQNKQKVFLSTLEPFTLCSFLTLFISIKKDGEALMWMLRLVR
jgi:hypothetical protein